MATSPLERILRHPLAAATANAAVPGPRHAVGGTVRDALMGLETQDLDVSVGRGGDRLAQEIARAVDGTVVALGGGRFSSFRVVAGTDQVDIWDRRGGTLLADLERRDLTINSIACDLRTGGLEDPFDGQTDLRDRVLRATRSDTFDRDPLRVLRLARFHHTLEDFELESGTEAAARDACVSLGEVAVERTRDELRQILARPPARRAFGALDRLGALAVLFPEASPSVVLLGAAGFDATLARLATSSGTPEPSADDRLLGAFALWIACATAESGAPGDRTAEVASVFERRGLAPRETLRRATRLAAASLPESDDDFRLFLAAHGSRWPAALAVASARDAAPPDRAASVAARLERLGETSPELLLPATPLLDGHEAAGILGVAPGPAVGEALRALVRAQTLGRITSRDEARAFLRERARADPGG